jgi:putative DNA primase/helicase
MLDLLTTMQNYGLRVTSLNLDGEIHRCGTAHKPRSKNGWYCVYDDGAAAIYGNWEEGDGYQYWASGALNTSTATLKAKIEATQRKREADHDVKAEEAQDYIESLARTGFSDYLKRKKIYPHGVRFDGNCIVIPLQDASGKVWSYQRIYADGKKYFLEGGKTRGCYYMITTRNVSKDERVVVCEGFATGASIHQATGLPVIVALNAGNLKAVCDSLIFRNIIIAADNDESGVGENYARSSSYPYVMPDKLGADFSDLFLEGIDFSQLFQVNKHADNHAPINVGGIVGMIADWITSTAIRPQPELSLAAALSFVAMLKGHKVCGSTDLRTNLLVLSLAPTAAGKEHPQNCMRRLAIACGLDKHMMGEPVSGGGFLTGLSEAGSVALLVMDEMGRYIGNINNKNSGSYQREIIDYMVKSFSCANSVLIGRQHVDTKKNPKIDIKNPHFTCLGSTVPERLQAACSSAEVIDGFLNRFIIFSTNERPKRTNITKSREVPESLIKLISEYRTKHPIYDNYGQPMPNEVRFTPEAWDVFEKYRDKMESLLDKAKFPISGLYGRSVEHVEKICLTICDDEDILVSDVKTAIAIVDKSNKAILEFSGMIADNEMERDFIRVREKIKDEKEISKGELTYKCQFVQGGARRLAEIVAALCDKNVIVERKSGNKTSYKWIG